MGRTRTRTAAGITLDTGALIALNRGDKRMIALLDRALAQGRTFRLPSGVLGEAWRDGRVQVTLARFLRSEEVEIIPLDDQLARSCGELCGATNTLDMIDASVVILARERRDPIVQAIRMTCGAWIRQPSLFLFRLRDLLATKTRRYSAIVKKPPVLPSFVK